MVERNALDPTKRPGNVTRGHAKWMGVGVTLDTGAGAVDHVAL